jgi:hypothetical protein
MNEASDADVRALRHMVDELRASMPPELDWAGLERRTFDRIDRAALARTGHAVHGPRGGVSAALAFAIAAAAFILLLASQQVSAPRVSGSAGPNATPLASLPTITAGGERAYLASAIASGSRLMSGVDVARFAWPGVASWELDPGTSLVLDRAGGWPRLTLEHGRIRAHVVPREDTTSMLEALVVEAGGTRVAVHGTTFSVSRDGDEVVVEVLEGVVAVGPSGQRGPTHGALLRGPSKAAFSATNGKLVEERPNEPRRTASPLERSAPRGDGAEAREALDGALAISPSSPSVGRSMASAPASPAAIGNATATGSPPSAGAVAMPSTESTVPPPGTAARATSSSPPADSTTPPVERLSLASVRSQLIACLSASDGPGDDGGLRIMVSSEVRLRLDAEGRVAGLRFDPPLRPDRQQRCAAALFGRLLDSASTSPSVRVEFSTH